MADQSLEHAAQVWAASQMGLGPGCGSAEVRRAFWVHLAETGFASHGSRIEAVDLLLRIPGAVREPFSIPQFRHDYEQALADEVAAFEGQFFSLNPSDRRARWTSLASRAATFPRLCWRLNRWQSGLAVDLHRLDASGDKTNLVAEWCGELFLLGPKSRSARKLELLSQLRDETQQELIDAARQVRRLAPEIAALAPDLVSEMSQHKRSLRRRARRQHSLARRQWWHHSRDRVIFISTLVIIAAAWLAGMVVGEKPRSGVQQRSGQSDLQQILNERARVTIDADVLLDAADPLGKAIELSRQHLFQVRANAEQVQQLKQKMGVVGFRLCFGNGIGDGMSQLVEPDKAHPATPDWPAQVLPDDAESNAEESSDVPEANVQLIPRGRDASLEELLRRAKKAIEEGKSKRAEADKPAPANPAEGPPK